MSVQIQQVAKDAKPQLSFTEPAVAHLLSYLQKNADYKGVRLSVKKTGCSGLSYVVDYVLEEVADDLVIPLREPYFIYVEKSSYPFLKGMKIDFLKEGLNSKFVFDNPNQTGQCGCGESFTVS